MTYFIGGNVKSLLLASTIALVLLLMSGCSELSSPAGPAKDPANEGASVSGEMMNPPVSEDLACWRMDPDESVATLRWPLPQPADIPLNQSFVTKQAGGSIPFSFPVPAADGKVINVLGSFVVPPGALANDTKITLWLDAHDMALHFQPEGLLFASETTLNWTIAGLGPLAQDPPIRFCYDDENGTVVEIPSRGLTVDYDLGVIQLKEGFISHFSRYAFIRW